MSSKKGKSGKKDVKQAKKAMTKLRRDYSSQFDRATLLGLQTQIECLQERLDAVIQNRVQVAHLDQVETIEEITIHGIVDEFEVFQATALCVLPPFDN